MRGVAANCGFVVRLGRVYSGFMESRLKLGVCLTS